MIDNGFLNQILITADNALSFGKLGNLYFSPTNMSDNSRLLVYVAPINPRFSIFVLSEIFLLSVPIIVDNALSSRKPSNFYPFIPNMSCSFYLFALIKLSSPFSSTFIMSDSYFLFVFLGAGSRRLFVLVKSFNLSNCIPHFLTNILTNHFGNFSRYTSSNLTVDFVLSFAILFFDIFTFVWFLQSYFLTLDRKSVV